MSVGGVRRGGKGGAAKGPTGAKAPSSSFKVGGAEAAGRAAGKSAVAGAAGSSEAEALSSIRSELATIAAGLRDGTIASKSAAAQRAVQMILEKKSLLGGANSKAAKRLIQQIADTLQDDPRLAAALERTWSRASDS